MSDFTKARDEVTGQGKALVQSANWKQRGLLLLSHLVVGGIGAFLVWVF